MSKAFLKLTIGDLTVTHNQFFNEVAPRIDAEGQEDEVIYTPPGSTVIQGTDYDNWSIWNVDAYCTKDDFDTLCLIRVEQRYRRQHGLNEPFITVVDTTQKMQERAPRTRALAPGAIEGNRSPYIVYYAQYKAVMLSRPEFRLVGDECAVRYRLQEIEKTSP